MSLESQLFEADEEVQMARATADEEVQMARATAADITRRVRLTFPLFIKYDVFLSFRGLDTRTKFTDHLYNALKFEGFLIFRDEDEIEPGENIKSELREAIRSSSMSVVVLSENYANSTACMFELQTILELQKTSGHIVLPVFYDVNPLQIKKQAEKLDFENKTKEQLEAWSEALKEVARMKGMVSQNLCNGYEAPLIKAIVDFVLMKLFSDQVFHAEDYNLRRALACLNAQEEDIRDKLQSQMFQMWKRPKKEVVVWLGDVASLKADVQRLEQEVFGESRVYSRVRLGKMFDEKIRKVAELQERGRAFNDDLLVPLPLRLWMPSTNVESTEARNAEIIRECLRETLAVM